MNDDDTYWDKPALTVLLNGDTYYVCGFLDYHRVNGPAIIKLTGRVEWWYKDYHYEFDEWVEVSGCPPEQAVMLKLQYG